MIRTGISKAGLSAARARMTMIGGVRGYAGGDTGAFRPEGAPGVGSADAFSVSVFIQLGA
jgi:hypothetical protein